MAHIIIQKATARCRTYHCGGNTLGCGLGTRCGALRYGLMVLVRVERWRRQRWQCWANTARGGAGLGEWFVCCPLPPCPSRMRCKVSSEGMLLAPHPSLLQLHPSRLLLLHSLLPSHPSHLLLGHSLLPLNPSARALAQNPWTPCYCGFSLPILLQKFANKIGNGRLSTREMLPLVGWNWNFFLRPQH